MNITISRFGCVHYPPTSSKFTSFVLAHLGDVGRRGYITIDCDGSAVAYFLSEGFGRKWGHLSFPAGTVPVMVIRPTWVGDKQGELFDQLRLDIPGRPVPKHHIRVN